MAKIEDNYKNDGGEQSSRRRFFSRLGKLIGGLAVVIAGGSLAVPKALAVGLVCCTGIGCPDYSCPSGTHGGYNWTCDFQGGVYICYDCFNNSNGNYNCTYPQTQQHG